MSTPKDYASDVRGHYEELPYPYRDPAKEGTQYYGGEGFSLPALNHINWAGKRNLRKDTRILIAGDGTGDAAIQFAEACLGGNSEIVAVDLSSKSIEISKARLARRGLTNVTHHHMSLLDVAGSGLGQFDIIECCGVLHHLPDPDAGLRKLAEVLKDDGIMTIMVYAQYGRHAVYMMQEMMRRLTTPEMDRQQRIALARSFLDEVPQTNWLTVKNESFIPDIMFPDGSGIYDLFLHSIDRAYTVPQLYEWTAQAGLHLLDFYSDFEDGSHYHPERYTNSALLKAQLAEKTVAERHALAELMHGSMVKHHFYATKGPRMPAQLGDDMVIAYGPLQSLFTAFLVLLLEKLAKAAVGETVAVLTKPIPNSPALYVVKQPQTEMLLRLIDNQRSVGVILNEAMKISGVAVDMVRPQLAALYHAFKAQNLVFLRHRSVPAYITGPEVVERLKKILPTTA